MDSEQEWIQKVDEKSFRPEEEKVGKDLLFQDNKHFLQYGKTFFLKPKKRNHFKKAQKIKRQREISRLLKSGKRWNCTQCLIVCSENGINRNRYVIIVPKVNGSVVVRNKIKRYVREYFRLFFKNTPYHSDILVKIHPEIDVKKTKYRLEKALSLWLETEKK